MPSKTKTAETAQKAAQPQIPAEYLKQLIPGPVTIEIPRDRQASFEPQLIGKHERRFTGFD